MRTEAIRIPTLRGDPQLTNTYGFAWAPSDPANTLSEFALVSVDIEYEDGTRAQVTLRPRTWYGGRRRMTRVWFFASSAAAGTVAVMDYATEEGETIQPASAPPSESRVLASLAMPFAGGVLPNSGLLSVAGVHELLVTLRRAGDVVNRALVLSGLLADGSEVDFSGAGTTALDPVSRWFFGSPPVGAGDFPFVNLAQYVGVIPQSFRIRTTGVAPAVATTLLITAFRK